MLGFIEDFKSTLPDTESNTAQSPTKFDCIKNMCSLQNIKKRQSFAIQGSNPADLSGLDPELLASPLLPSPITRFTRFTNPRQL